MKKKERNYHFAHSRIIGGILLLLVMLSVGVNFNDIQCFIDVHSMVCVFGITFSLLLMNFGNDLFKFIPNALFSFFVIYNKPNQKYAEIAKLGNRYAIVAGGIGFITGLINMLQHLEDPSEVGVGLAVAMLTFFYGIILAECVFTFLYISYLKGEEYRGVPPLQFKYLILIYTLILAMLVVFFLLLLTLSEPL